MSSKNFFFDFDLAKNDDELMSFVKLESARQNDKIIMIASESVCPKPVREAYNSPFTNKYAEGYPSLRMSHDEKEKLMDIPRFMAFQNRYGDRRHYKGCDFANFIESLAQKRCADLFATPEFPANMIHVNVQPLSGAAANNAVYEAFTKPGDVVMGMALNNGGHLTHGSEFNRSGKTYKIVSYEVDKKTGKIDHENMKELALKYRPKMIIAGASAYPWTIDWTKIREVADLVGAYVLADIAHPSGLVVAGLFPNPVGIVHATTFTTHKTMCGPRGAVIISTDEAVSRKLDNAVFPGEQGGPHMHTIAAKAVAFKIAATPEFKELQHRVVYNCQALGEELKALGMKLAYGGTNTHLLLIDLNAVKTRSGEPIKGDTVSNILDLCNITCNKNTIAGDPNAAFSSAIRLGTTVVSQRGMGKDEMKTLARIIHKVVASVDTFGVHTGGGFKGRGKLPMSVIEEARAEVKKLTDKFPCDPQESPKCSMPELPGLKHCAEKDQTDALKNGAGVVDMTDYSVFQLRGGRAEHFLQSVCSANIATMQPMDSSHCLVFDVDHNLLDDPFVVRKGFDEPHNFDYYTVITAPTNACKLKRYFAALSDGYIYFDKTQNIRAKVDGPVVIECLDARFFGVAGPKAAETAAKISKEAGALKHNKSLEFQMAGQKVLAINMTTNPKVPFFGFAVPAAAIAEFLKVTQKTGAPLVSPKTRDAMREHFNLPVYGKPMTVCEAYKRFSADFDLTKPYFNGQNSICADTRPKSDKKEFAYAADPNAPLKRSCLYEEHLKLTKKRNIVPFAGWEMPVLYSTIGEEHDVVRKAAGLFDVTHMGVFEIEGCHATRFLDIVTANYVSKMKIGQSQYSYLLGQNGRPHDDILVYRRGFSKYMMVVNAANADKDWAWINAVKNREVIIDAKAPWKEIEREVNIRNLKDPSAGKNMKVDMALQGPTSCKILQKLAGNNLACGIGKIKKSFFAEVNIHGMDVLVSRTGYTGEEIAFELYLHPNDAPKMWNLILAEGKEFGVQPTGLGARDSTRTEAGLPLYGHELAGALDISPNEAGYGSFVRLHKPFFIGKEPFIEKMVKTEREIVRFRMVDKGVKHAQTGDIVVNKKGLYVGKVTSCTLIGETQLGLALVDKNYTELGTELGIFNMPKKDDATSIKPLSKFDTGDKYPLPSRAVVLRRFMSQDLALAKK